MGPKKAQEGGGEPEKKRRKKVTVVSPPQPPPVQQRTPSPQPPPAEASLADETREEEEAGDVDMPDIDHQQARQQEEEDLSAHYSHLAWETSSSSSDARGQDTIVIEFTAEQWKRMGGKPAPVTKSVTETVETAEPEAVVAVKQEEEEEEEAGPEAGKDSNSDNDDGPLTREKIMLSAHPMIQFAILLAEFHAGKQLGSTSLEDYYHDAEEVAEE